MPTDGYSGGDSFIYKATDTNGLSATGTVVLNVQAVTPTPTPVVPPTVPDGGFEQPVAGTGNFLYEPAITAANPWTFTGHSGVTANSSGYTAGNPIAPEGVQVGYLQLGDAVISQSLSFPTAGTFTVQFLSAQRQNFNHGGQSFIVEIDGAPEGTITPAGITYASYSSQAFTVTGGSHTLSFVATNPHGADNTAFIDAVQVNSTTPTPTPTPTPAVTPITLNPTALNDATIGQSFSQQLTASGGTGSFTGPARDICLPPAPCPAG